MFILQITHNQSGEWIEINTAGDVISRREITALSDCPKINTNDFLVILIPGEQVTLMTVKLPKMRAQERARAVPFALEEQLATDPESVYVAITDSERDGTVTAAIMDKDDFNEDYELWHNAGLSPRVVLPDFLGIYFEPGTWTIVFHRNMALVRTGLHAGFSVDANNVVVVLSLLLDKTSDVKPSKIIVFQEDNVVPLAGLDKYGIPIEFDDDRKNKFDVSGLTVASRFNLLQGKYRPKSQASTLKKNWMLCGISAAAFFGFVFLSNIVQWIYWHHEATNVQAQVLQVYQRLFPGSQTVLEPHFRTEALLKKYEAMSHTSIFLKLFRAVGSTLLHFPDIHVNAFVFQDHTLKLTVDVPSDVMLSDWATALRAEHVSVQQSSTKSDQGAIAATVTVLPG